MLKVTEYEPVASNDPVKFPYPCLLRFKNTGKVILALGKISEKGQYLAGDGVVLIKGNPEGHAVGVYSKTFTYPEPAFRHEWELYEGSVEISNEE